MKIVITGATGYVGRNLVPLLREGGADMLLAGRDKAKISRMFPGFACCDYTELAEKAKGCTVLLHLAVLNNTSSEPLETFLKVNVDCALETAMLAREAGIETFVNFSSTHALDQSNTSSYAISKRKAADELAHVKGMRVINLYLPYVYNPDFSDRLTFLSKLPAPLARFAFSAIASLKPTVSIHRIAQVVASLDSRDPSDLAEPAIISDGQSGNPVYGLIMRGLDLVFALTVTVVFWWLLLIIWALVRFGSKGPGIFAQERVGRNGRPFTCYKFRTMQTGTAHLGTHEVSASSVTRLGAVLRKLKLDELPQIINIFRNEISLIGPRPCLPVQRELVEARRRLGVLALKPGISGLAQVNGVDMSDPGKLANLDARYLALQSLLLDLKIIIATALGSGNGDRVAK
ncbi:lipopolysaccharide/colanic/teichoic acid biosynthesis glycosyltransferase [Hoeflea halophila]|uniref:Lipopolysaccharide/colanic/teichoic acid biosynthesis glycosyltransferase n=1 Tax=Hoeflea halophila TaxID=714899 RepID=A0A286IEW0_9HYPH|nr:sugar transferase [Hoeflea halophila]SOE17834.1 lipopolysaccharide/colanic/teichoic acid biosynthesis glycosyltransferase [Hoeflea halophila]